MGWNFVKTGVRNQRGTKSIVYENFLPQNLVNTYLFCSAASTIKYSIEKNLHDNMNENSGNYIFGLYIFFA